MQTQAGLAEIQLSQQAAFWEKQDRCDVNDRREVTQMVTIHGVEQIYGSAYE